MRTFIAIEPRESLKNSLGQIQTKLKNQPLDARWVNPKNLHLTLKFLGQVTPEQINQINKVVDQVAKEFKAFTVSLRQFGFFPNPKQPRVFFLNPDNQENLKAIFSSLQEQLEIIGFPKKSRFSSHLTLARLKSNKNIRQFVEKIEAIEINFSFEVKEIAVFKSTLAKSGAIYEKIFSSSLTA